LHQDANAEVPRGGAPIAWLLLGGLVVLSVLAVAFKWLLAAN
jgi:hypothetical protein